MERSIAPMINHPDHEQGRNSAAALNSSLYVHLGSIPVPRMEAGKCKHFGIRQYVANMREKDRRTCFPFDSDGDSEQFLPSLFVPKYKYWLYKNCMYGNGAVSHLEDVVPISECNNETEIPENGSADSNFDRAIALSLATDKKDNCTEVAQIIENDQENVDKEESKEGTDDQGTVALKSKSIVLVGNGLAGSSGSNKATKLKKPTGSVKSQLVKHSSIQIEEESSEDSEGSRKKKRLGNQLKDILGFTVPKRKRKPRYRQGKKPMEAIVISDSDSEATIDGIAECKMKSGRKRSSLDSGKLDNLGSGKKTKVPWKEVINKNKHTEIIGGKYNNNNNSDADTTSSRSKKDSTTGREMEPKLRGRMPPRQQRERKSSLQNVSHKYTAGPYLEAQLQNVMNKFARREQRNHSALLSNRNIPLLQDLDFSDPHNNEKSRELRKSLEAMKRKRDKIADKGFTEGNSDKIVAITDSRYQEMHAPVMCRDKGKRIQNHDLNVLDLNGASLEKPDLVEKEFFPKSAPKNSSPFQKAENVRRSPPIAFKLFGRVIEKGKANDPYAPE